MLLTEIKHFRFTEVLQKRKRELAIPWLLCLSLLTVQEITLLMIMFLTSLIGKWLCSFLGKQLSFIILTFFKYGFFTNIDFLYPCIFLTNVDVLLTQVNLISHNNLNYSKYFFSIFTLPIKVPVSSFFVKNANQNRINY